LEATGALGPDRQWFKLPQGRPFEGTITVFAEDGITRLGSQAVTLQPGVVYRLEWALTEKAGAGAASPESHKHAG